MTDIRILEVHTSTETIKSHYLVPIPKSTSLKGLMALIRKLVSCLADTFDNIKHSNIFFIDEKLKF